MLGILTPRLFGNYVEPRIARQLLAVPDEVEAVSLSNDAGYSLYTDTFGSGNALYLGLQILVLSQFAKQCLIVLLHQVVNLLKQFLAMLADGLVRTIHVVEGFHAVRHRGADLAQVGMEAGYLAQFPINGSRRRPRAEFPGGASHQCQTASVHGIRLGLDTLCLAPLAGLVGQHHIDRQAYLVEVVGQLLVVGACRLHEICERLALHRLFAAPLNHLVKTCLSVGEVDTLRTAARVACPVIHVKADRELLLGDVNSYALAEELAHCHL